MRGNATGQLEERTKPVLLGWAYRRQDRRARALLQSAIGIAKEGWKAGKRPAVPAPLLQVPLWELRECHSLSPRPGGFIGPT